MATTAAIDPRETEHAERLEVLAVRVDSAAVRDLRQRLGLTRAELAGQTGAHGAIVTAETRPTMTGASARQVLRAFDSVGAGAEVGVPRRGVRARRALAAHLGMVAVEPEPEPADTEADPGVVEVEPADTEAPHWADELAADDAELALIRELDPQPVRLRLNGERVAAARRRFGCSQAEFARTIGMLPSSLCRLERGSLTLSVEGLREITQALMRIQDRGEVDPAC